MNHITITHCSTQSFQQKIVNSLCPTYHCKQSFNKDNMVWHIRFHFMLVVPLILGTAKGESNFSHFVESPRSYW